MATTSPKAMEILDAAERFVRHGGYNGFSFRDIASAVNIKSASVHYHFPTKADLGTAVARRYADRFMDGLGDPDDGATPPAKLIRGYIDAFRVALVRDKQMCLCGILGTEVASLPGQVAGEARRFFERSVDWLEQVLRRDGSISRRRVRQRALLIIAALEGAMIMARALDDNGVFDRVAAELVAGNPFQ